MSPLDLPAAAPRRLRPGPPPPGAVPLARFTDRWSVADLVTIAVGESTGYADDVAAGTLAIFESVVDAALLRASIAVGNRGTKAAVPLDTTFVALDRHLRIEGLWTVRGGSRRLRVRPEEAVRRVVTAFAPYVRGEARALSTLAAARTHLAAERLSLATGLAAAG